MRMIQSKLIAFSSVGVRNTTVIRPKWLRVRSPHYSTAAAGRDLRPADLGRPAPCRGVAPRALWVDAARLRAGPARAGGRSHESSPPRRHGATERRRHRQRAPLGLRPRRRPGLRGRDAGPPLPSRTHAARPRAAPDRGVDDAARQGRGVAGSASASSCWPRSRRRSCSRALPDTIGRRRDRDLDRPRRLDHARPDASPARRGAPRDRRGRGAPAGLDVARGSATHALLAPLRHELRGPRPSRDRGHRRRLAVLAGALGTGDRRVSRWR